MRRTWPSSTRWRLWWKRKERDKDPNRSLRRGRRSRLVTEETEENASSWRQEVLEMVVVNYRRREGIHLEGHRSQRILRQMDLWRKDRRRVWCFHQCPHGRGSITKKSNKMRRWSHGWVRCLLGWGYMITIQAAGHVPGKDKVDAGWSPGRYFIEAGWSPDRNKDIPMVVFCLQKKVMEFWQHRRQERLG